MKVGYSIDPEGDHIEQISEAPEEFDFIELAIGELEKPLEDIHVPAVKEALEAKDLELTIHLPFRQPVVTVVEEFNKAKLDYYERLLEFCSELGAGKAVVHVNVRYGEEPENIMEELKPQMERINELGEQFGVEICFENLPNSQSRPLELEELGIMIEEIGGSMCFDTGHAVAEKDQEEAWEFVEEFSHVISHLHVQDTRDRRDSHLSIGDGELDFEEFVERLGEFDGTACIEIFTDDADQLLLSRQKLLEKF